MLGIGSSFTNETTITAYGLQSALGNGTILHGLLMIMNKAGGIIFDNLPLIFAVGLTFSGGLLDLFLFGILQGNSKTSWLPNFEEYLKTAPGDRQNS